jgi:nucleoside-diphosphate-sugar epimerase
MEESMADRIIVTGASGFIGTNLLNDFIEKGYEVINIDFKVPQFKKQINYWKDVDITNYDLFEKTVLDFNPDYIIHLAARTDLDGMTLEDYSANTIGVDNLLRIVRKLSDLKKVLIISSRYVCPNGYYPKDQFDYAPHTKYGESKVVTEKNVWANEPHCDWSILRPTSIWGPWFGIPYRNFFDTVVKHMYFHFGKKPCYKTYGYVGNSIYQIEQLLFNETPDKDNKVFYIGDTPAYNIGEWADEIAHELGFKVPKVPFWIIKCVAKFGDFVKIFGVHFPMTSFRLYNMTTDNINDMSNTVKIAPKLLYTRVEGIKITLKWIEKKEEK